MVLFVLVSEPRHHHIVPRFHLKRFANERGQVKVVARDDFRKIFVTSVDDILAQRDFYTVDTDGESSQDVEKMLSAIEGECAEVTRLLLEGVFPPAEENRGRVAAFLALQWVRGWGMRRDMEHFLGHMIKMRTVNTTRASLRNFFRETEDREASDEEIEDLIAIARNPAAYTIKVNQGVPVGMMLKMFLQLAPLVLNRKWQLLRAREGAFVTSDAPVSLWTSPENLVAFGYGFATADELVMALDRRYALVCAHDAPSGETIREVGREHVREINKRTASWCSRYIIHHPDDTPLDGVDIPPSRPAFTVTPSEPFRIVPDDA